MKNFARSVKHNLVFYRNLLSFLFSLFSLISKSHKNVWMRDRLTAEFQLLVKFLSTDTKILKTKEDSKSAYNLYDDREIIADYKDSQVVLMNNAPVLMSYREQRLIHLSYIFSEIDAILKKKDKALVLEVGCGNCINIFEIMQKYGDRVEVHGVDIAENRINVGRGYFKDGLANAKLKAASITERTDFADGQFDLVYSVFCIEQIAYETKAAVEEMYRISGDKVLMLEPVFENGSIMQKIYLVWSDHTRILLKSIRELNLPLVKNEVLPMQFNPSNQSTMLLIDKAAI
ncbi:hypothetical protein D3C72_351190 [compost metagenome]